jgi:hypothetical protein
VPGRCLVGTAHRQTLSFLSFHSSRNTYAHCGGYAPWRNSDETQVCTCRNGRSSRSFTFGRNRFRNASGSLGTFPDFERRDRCAGLRSARLCPHLPRVSPRLRGPSPLCPPRLRIWSLWASRLSPVLMQRERASALFSCKVRLCAVRPAVASDYLSFFIAISAVFFRLSVSLEV